MPSHDHNLPPQFPVQAGIVDPSLIAVDPALQRSYDSLKQEPLNAELIVEGGESIDLPVANKVPIANQRAENGQTLAMLYGVNANGEEYQVWVKGMPDGSVDANTLDITKKDYDARAPQDDPRSWKVTLDISQPTKLHLPTGDKSKFVSFELDKFGLQIGVRRGQEPVTVLARGGAKQEATADTPSPKKTELAGFAGSTLIDTLPPDFLDRSASEAAKKEDIKQQTPQERLFGLNAALNPRVSEAESAPSKADFNFDDLFITDDAEYEAAMARRVAAEVGKERSRESPRDVVTPEGEAAAITAVSLAMAADRRLYSIINESPVVRKNYLSGSEYKSIPELLRTDADLRMTVGTYLLDKLQNHVHPNALPYQVRMNKGKTPSTPGYKGIVRDSEEYATLLALSMLDGTFNASRASGDAITYDPKKDSGTGQHRYAAAKLLAGNGKYPLQY